MRTLPDLLTTAEVSEVLKVHPKTLAGWRRRRVGPTFIIVECRVRYPRAALCAYLEANTQTAAS